MAAFEHLIGHVSFYDVVNHIMVGGTMELYADRKKAIVWITNHEHPERNDRIVFRQPPVVSSYHILICSLRDVQGTVDLGKDPIAEPELAMCVACSGVGWNNDEDGNEITCERCNGEGWF
jgi:hypothetical protein